MAQIGKFLRCDPRIEVEQIYVSIPFDMSWADANLLVLRAYDAGYRTFCIGVKPNSNGERDTVRLYKEKGDQIAGYEFWLFPCGPWKDAEALALTLYHSYWKEREKA